MGIKSLLKGTVGMCSWREEGAMCTAQQPGAWTESTMFLLEAGREWQTLHPLSLLAQAHQSPYTTHTQLCPSMLRLASAFMIYALYFPLYMGT